MSRPEPKSDESDLVARIARGDERAIVSVYRAHHHEVRRFAQRLLGDLAAAEDLLHDVFVALPKAMARFRGECSLRGYLIAVASRHAHHHLRTLKRRRAAEVRLELEPQRASAQPDAQAERAELARMLTAALDALPTDQRVAFVLCEVEERTSVEVAELLGEKDGTIRARIFHAKKKLRAELAKRAENGVHPIERAEGAR